MNLHRKIKMKYYIFGGIVLVAILAMMIYVGVEADLSDYLNE